MITQNTRKNELYSHKLLKISESKVCKVGRISSEKVTLNTLGGLFASKGDIYLGCRGVIFRSALVLLNVYSSEY